MKESLIKSKKRVQQHGEVFTPAWMVQKMLDTPGIKEACEDIQATFLEPSAGDGNFLQAILERKLASLVSRYPKSTWKDQSLAFNRLYLMAPDLFRGSFFRLDESQDRRLISPPIYFFLGLESST